MKARDAFVAVLGVSGLSREVDAGSASVPPLFPRVTGSASAQTAPRIAHRVGGVAVGALLFVFVLAFAAVPALAAGPAVTISDATNVGYTTAEVSGSVNPGGRPTEWRFEYISDEQYQANLDHALPGFHEATPSISGSTTTMEAVGGTIAGLHAGTTYHLRLFARNVEGSSAATAGNFTTEGVAPPVLSEVEATEVEYATATATGKVEISGSDSSFNPTICQFEVATEQQWEDHGSSFPEGPFQDPAEAPIVRNCDVGPTGPGTTTVKAEFSGLAAATVYHLRLVVENQSGDPVILEAASTFETKPVAAPGLTGPSASSVTATSAHFSGTVSPNAPEPITAAIKAGYNVRWFYTCTPTCFFSGPSGGEVEAGQPATEVSAEAILEPNLSYTVTLHAVNAGGEVSSQASFSTPAVAPEVSYPFVGSAINRTATGARLVAAVNPHNSQLTDCHFDFGPTTSYGRVVPCEEEPTGGNSFAPAAADVSGLEPSTKYHFRLVAANAVGTQVGADQTVKTFPIEGPVGSCANDAARAEQRAELLPECRAWEMVSPLDKNGNNIVSEAANVVPATDGEAAEFLSRGGFSESAGSGNLGMFQYIARRGSNGWATKSFLPTPSQDAALVFLERSEAGIFSEDLSKAVTWSYDLPGLTDDLPHETNLYQQDTLTGALRTVTIGTQLTGQEALAQYVNLTGVGASADLEVITFPSVASLLPEAAPEVENIYEWNDGTLRLAGILPDGTVPPQGSSLPETDLLFTRYRESVSADGSRLTFLAQHEGQTQLYLRRNHSSTAWVSESEASVPALAANVRLQWMSPDGHHLLFTTTSRLTDEDTNGNRDLYLYTDGPDPSTETNLQLISQGSHASEDSTAIVLGASNDAGRIYFLGPNNTLVLWDHGTSKAIARLTGGREQLGATSYPGAATVSADGGRIAFLSEAVSLSEQYGLTGQSTGGQQQMYVYDASDETLTCASCPASGTAPRVPLTAEASQHTAVLKDLPQVRTRWLSSDGRKVFFSTEAALVPGDINGLSDVYVYNTETGTQRLISSGRGEAGAWYENASVNGDNAFFVTHQELVGRDTDELSDLYDARVGGGFIEPPPPPAPCSGDGCRGRLSSAAAVSSPATSAFSGPGNPHRRAKKHHKRRKHHRVRKAHKHGHKSKHGHKQGVGK